jgi:hypothetical protein
VFSINIIPTLKTKRNIAKWRKFTFNIQIKTGCSDTPKSLTTDKANRAIPMVSPIINVFIAVSELIFFENKAKRKTAVIGGLTNA